jgi:Flp pilus assembly protein TadD
MVGSTRQRLGIAIALALSLAGCASYQGARLYQSGTAALDRDEPERAIADLERAAELVPAASQVQNHLGLAYAAAGRDQDALLAFRRAVELDCDNGAAVQNLRGAEQRRTAGAQP